MASSKVTLDTRGLDRFVRNLDASILGAVVATANAIRDEAKALAPVDTEALRESIHVVTAESSDYDSAMSAARSRFDAAKQAGQTPKGRSLGEKSTFQGWDQEVRPSVPNEAWVVVGMQYGVYVEFGTGRMAAQPFLLPAVMRQEGEFLHRVGKAIDGATGAVVRFRTFSTL